MSPKKLFKTLVLSLCAGLGLVLRKRPYPAVLMYHSFDTAGWRYGVDPDDLGRQLAYLAERYQFVSLTDIADYVKEDRPLASRAVAITIDDGYEDTYRVFYPLAKKYQIPFTLFLTTNLNPLPQLGNLPRPTWAMLREMHESGLLTIGLHGHHHTHFTTVWEQGQQPAEIDQSIASIEQELGVTPQYVAYPSGRYTHAIAAYFADVLQYQAGVTIRSGFVRPGDAPMELKRIEVHRRITWTQFKLRLYPGYEWYDRMVHMTKRLYAKRI